MKRILVHAVQDEVRVAITLDNRLIDLDIENQDSDKKKANIYKGIITSIEPSLGAVFVNYGSERHGFLPLKEISREYFLAQDNLPIEDVDIRKVLKIGQELVVQVDKEERGTKGAALTTFISLAGSDLVLMPNNPRGGGVSRRIDGEEREQMKEVIDQLHVPEGMSIIVRTAGVGKSKEELEWDLNVLFSYWDAIKQAAVMKSGYYLIHQESDVIIRAIRDYLRQDIAEIIIDDEKAFEHAKNYIQKVRPDFVDRLKLYTDHLPLFSRFQIEKQIESAYQRELNLPSGGSIVIDNTEALVSIDINSSRATKGSDIEETAYQTNLEAAEEIARQLRIRDIGGLIVIDFIDMTPIAHQRDVENRLRDALKLDRARVQIGRISRFGLLEMSRQRLRSSLSKSIEIPCPNCKGRGTIRSVDSVGLSILHLIQEQAAMADEGYLHVQLPLDTATFLANEKRKIIEEIESSSRIKVIIVPNPYLQFPDYQMKLVKDESTRGTPSYQLAKTQKTEASMSSRKISPVTKMDEPAITRFLSNEPSQPKKIARKSIIKKILKKLFGEKSRPLAQKKYSSRESERPRGRYQGQGSSYKDKPRSAKPRKPRNPNAPQRTESSRYEARPKETVEKPKHSIREASFEKDIHKNPPIAYNKKEESQEAAYAQYEAMKSAELSPIKPTQQENDATTTHHSSENKAENKAVENNILSTYTGLSASEPLTQVITKSKEEKAPEKQE